jgi:hypothetical protein
LLNKDILIQPIHFSRALLLPYYRVQLADT